MAYAVSGTRKDAKGKVSKYQIINVCKYGIIRVSKYHRRRVAYAVAGTMAEGHRIGARRFGKRKVLI